MNEIVYLRKMSGAAEVPEVREAVATGLQAFPGVLEQIRASSRILLKPNVTGAHTPEDGRTTHPSVIAATIEAIRSISNPELVIADSAVVGLSTDEAFCHTGILEVGNTHSVRVVDLKQRRFRARKTENARLFRTIEVSTILEDVDMIINMPKLKTNYGCKVGIGIKNLKGLISDKYKRLFHLRGLQEGLCDLYGSVGCDLTIVDGILGSELNQAKSSEVLLMSDNVLCADLVGSLVMGIDPAEVQYIKWLFAQEFGAVVDWSKHVDVVGERITDCATQFRCAGSQYGEMTPFEDVTILGHSACSGCVGTVESGFDKLRRLGYPRDCLSGMVIVTGSEVPGSTSIADMASTNHGSVVVVGNCMSRYVGEADYHIIEGCPPTKGDFVAFFEQFTDKG